MKPEKTHENIILCFCKHPIAGLVKSRLAKDIGDQPAAEIYTTLLDETIKTLGNLDLKVFLYCYPDTQHPTLKHYASEFNLILVKQQGEDLGMKMYNAFENHLNTVSNKANLVLIGTDCLDIDTAYIHKAFEHLHTGSDIVLGPATDGGYALIGANRIDQSIFENVNWSTNQVLKQTEENIKKLKWKYSLLSPVRDLDNLQDYEYFSTQDKFQHLFKQYP